MISTKRVDALFFKGARAVGAQVREQSASDGREWREESAPVGARQSGRCRARRLRQGAILANGRAGATNRQTWQRARNQAVSDRSERQQAGIAAGAPECRTRRRELE